MAKRIRETHYSLRTTFFRNNYEEPGEEFEIDPEDPVGLVSAQRRMDLQDEIHGDNVPGIAMESRMNRASRRREIRVLESQFRKAARRASRMGDNQLVNETVVLTEFIGKALKTLRNVWQRGLFQSIGRGLATLTKKSLGGQKDVDRKFALNAEKQFIDKFAAESADGTEIDFNDPATIKTIASAANEYAKALLTLVNDDESVFPRYGKIHHGGKGEDEEDGETTDEKDRARFAKEQAAVNRRLSDLVKKSGIVRGIMFAIRRTLKGDGEGKGVDIKIGDSVVDATYPLSYVISNLHDMKNVWQVITEKTEGAELEEALDNVEEATQKFNNRFKPELEKLQRNVLENAVAQLIANRAVLQERRLLD
jgi:hypothetical protein